MTEKEPMEEKYLSFKLRSILGEEYFWAIAETNPDRYLGSTVSTGGYE